MALMEITRDDFKSRYDNENTQAQVENSFNAFDGFLDSLSIRERDLIARTKAQAKAENDDEKIEIYRILDKMIRFWSQDKHPNTINVYWNYVKLWLEYNGLVLERHLIKRFIKFPEAKKSRPIAITREVIQKLVERSPLKYQLYILLMASGGFRGKKEIFGLKVGDIDFNMTPTKITVRAEIAKNGIERISFITPECSDKLKEHIEGLKNSDPVLDYTYQAFHKHLTGLRDKVGMGGKIPNSRFYHLRTHKFRKFCETNISNTQIPGVESDEFAHAILGHEKYLMTYYETPDVELAKLYENAIPKLTISDAKRNKDKADAFEKQLAKHEQLSDEVKALKAKILRLEMQKPKGARASR